MAETTFTITDDESGERIDVVLAERLGESRSAAAGRLSRDEVSVDGTTVAKSHRVSVGERVAVAAPPSAPTGGAGVPVPPIRYEDDHLLVVSKPPGLVVHPGAGHPSGTLVQVLADAGTPLAPAGGDLRPGIVHRLDRDTSGLLVVAKTDAAYHGLIGLLKARDVRRRYLALLQGIPPAVRGRVDAPIGRDPSDRTRFACLPSGKHAITHWEVLADGDAPGVGAGAPRVSLVSCRLETGRTHQIRVHMSYAGTPVVGDRLYGARRDVAEVLGAERFLLHAVELGFRHPVTGEDVLVTEPWPDDLTRAASLAGIDTERDTAAG